MATFHTGNVTPSTELEEHRSINGVNAKAVVPYSFGAAALTPAPTPFLDLAFDYIGFSNADGNGNYQTIVFNAGGAGGTTQRTLSLTYDGASNVTSIARS